MEKKKYMTQKEKAERARIKKELQSKGLIPPDKPRLNRKKFLNDVQEEWSREINLASVKDCFYFMNALSWMLTDVDRPVSSEQIGVLKLMKLTVETKRFHERLAEQGRNSFRLEEEWDEVVKPVLKL